MYYNPEVIMALDTQTKLAIMKRIDDFIEEERVAQPGVPDTTIMMPEINRVAEEHELDVTDLFIMYMDHIAITNKRVAQEAEEELDFTNIKRFY